MFRNPDHVTVAVADPKRATSSSRPLGFQKNHVAMINDEVPAKYMGMPDMKAEHITLVLEGCTPRFEIQLLAFESVPGADLGEHATHLRRRGYNHLALRVDDSAHLEANGVKMLSEELDYISRRLRLFEGPEWITLELVKWIDPSTTQP